MYTRHTTLSHAICSVCTHKMQPCPACTAYMQASSTGRHVAHAWVCVVYVAVCKNAHRKAGRQANSVSRQCKNRSVCLSGMSLPGEEGERGYRVGGRRCPVLLLPKMSHGNELFAGR